MQVRKQQLKPDIKKMDWFLIEKGVHQGYIATLLIYLYAEYIMWNAGLDEAQAGIKIAGRIIKPQICR